LIIRAATPSDAAAIAAVDVASWRAAYGGLMPDAFLDALSVDEKTASWAASLTREALRGKQTLVGDQGGAVLGYVTVGPDTVDHFGSVLLMYVEPDSWGRGIGQALMNDAIAALRGLGYERIALSVLERNERARRFYDAAGWTQYGPRSFQDYDGVTLAVLRLERAT
jgi:ribosomal protein S18 acetylase RimI-like enzyme